MIYKDVYANSDNSHYPMNRIGQLCINCSEFYPSHKGWACRSNSYNAKYSFNEIPPRYRYLTKSMVDSLQDTPASELKVEKEVVVPKSKPDISDWRAWKNNRSGECDCGIMRSNCIYHK